MDDPASVLKLRQKLWAQGYRPLAVWGPKATHQDAGKAPVEKLWRKRALTDPPAATANPAQPGALNTGILCDGLRAIDIDIDDPAIASAVRSVAYAMLGNAPTRTRSNSPRSLLLYRATEGAPTKISITGANHKTQACKVEVLGAGQQFVAYGVHASGAALEWYNDAPHETPRASLVALSEAQIAAFLEAAKPLIGWKAKERKPAPTLPSTPRTGNDSEHWEAALERIPNSGAPDWDEWIKIGLATFAASGGSGAGFAAWRAWSAKNAAFDDAATAERWEHFRRSPPSELSAGTLVYEARKYDPTFLKKRERQYAAPPQAKPIPAQAKSDDQEETNNEIDVNNIGNWTDKLIRNDKKLPLANVANAMLAFREAPEFMDSLAFDTFHLKVFAKRKLPWWSAQAGNEEWTDTHDVRAAEWLQHHGINIAPVSVASAVEAVARERSFHPVLDYLARCEWDGVHRIDNWMRDYLGAADNAYTQAVSAKWLISAVARVHQPGVKADCAIVLEGPQGKRKSSAIELMGSPWFTDDVSSFGSKDSKQEMAGVWIIELAELDGFDRSELRTIKAFMSRRTDRYRASYGRRINDYPRQNVFAGTCNENDYLRDPTGGRRFWPVACGAIDTQSLGAVKDQLWAEARVRYMLDEPHWLDTPELVALAQDEQQARYQTDVWQSLVGAYLDSRLLADDVEIGAILSDAIGIPKEKWTRTEQMRVAAILKILGWKRVQRSASGIRYWVYERPSAGSTG